MRFRIGNTEFLVSFWFFAVLALFAAANAAAFSLYIALPVLVHELGHLAAIAACGAEISAVRFTAFGVEMEKSKTVSLSLPREMVVSLAGIAANLAMAAGLYFFVPRTALAAPLIAANLAVAGFNLLPVGSLDGGEVVSTLCGHYLHPRAAYVLSRMFSFIILTPLFAAAVFLLLRPERNFTLLLVCGCLLMDVIAKN